MVKKGVQGGMAGNLQIPATSTCLLNLLSLFIMFLERGMTKKT
jgi:hypothetical protein